MAVWYVDSSVAAHVVLPDGNPAAEVWFERASTAGLIYSSTLLELELLRLLRREGLPVAWASSVADRMQLLRISDAVMRDAGAIQPHVRSLDAIHLATFGLLGPGAILVTHDTRMKQVARDLGREFFDPLAAP